jgi:hypothetical protein
VASGYPAPLASLGSAAAGSGGPAAAPAGSPKRDTGLEWQQRRQHGQSGEAGRGRRPNAPPSPTPRPRPRRRAPADGRPAPLRQVAQVRAPAAPAPRAVDAPQGAAGAQPLRDPPRGQEPGGGALQAAAQVCGGWRAGFRLGSRRPVGSRATAAARGRTWRGALGPQDAASRSWPPPHLHPFRYRPEDKKEKAERLRAEGEARAAGKVRPPPGAARGRGPLRPQPSRPPLPQSALRSPLPAPRTSHPAPPTSRPPPRSPRRRSPSS